MMLDMGKLFGVKEGSWKRNLAGVNDSKQQHHRPKAQSCMLRCGLSQSVM